MEEYDERYYDDDITVDFFRIKSTLQSLINYQVQCAFVILFYF